MIAAPPPQRFVCGPTRLPVLVLDGPDAVAEGVVAEVQRALTEHERPAIGLATGATFAPVFERILARTLAGAMPFKRARLTHLDEFVGWPSAQPGGMVHELGERLLGPLKGHVPRFEAVPAIASEPDDALRADLIRRGPLDLQLLGIGANGHVAFNEPGTPFSLRHHVTPLTERTLGDNARRFAGSEPPTHALTLGPAEILRSKRLVLAATGEAKADAVKAMLEGPVDPACPASLMRLHRSGLVLLDRAAASALSTRAWSRPRPRDEVLLPAEGIPAPGPVVVISPHPDDASISCGGLLAALAPGTRRVILTATTGARAIMPDGPQDEASVAALREEEVRREAAHLGAEAIFLRAQAYNTGAFEADDAARMHEMLRRIKPAWVLVPDHEDSHPTHRVVRALADEALRRLVQDDQHPTEIWTYEGPWHQLPRSEVNALVTLDDRTEGLKLAAVREHQSQLARLPFDAGAEALARLRGVSFGETHLGGVEPGRVTEVPRLEAYRRELWSPDIP